MLTSSMSGGSCVATRLTSRLASRVREQRPELYGQSRRCCRPLRRPAREGHCAMRGREALDPGRHRARDLRLLSGEQEGRGKGCNREGGPRPAPLLDRSAQPQTTTATVQMYITDFSGPYRLL